MSGIDTAALGELEGSFRGELVRPAEPSYEEHRKVWNGSIDRRPALIARCAEAAATASPVCRCATTASSSTSG